MIRFPSAKINLGLNVIRKRPDGYHDLRSVMIPIALHDILEVVVHPKIGDGKVEFVRTGIEVPGRKSEDLCLKAIKTYAGSIKLPGLMIHLHKVIPIGAGMGGGSSDGANMLLLLNQLFGEKREKELETMAAALGSDCTFFLKNVPQLIEGRGDRTQPFHGLGLSGKWLVLIDPGIHVSTAEVYRSISPKYPQNDLLEILRSPIRAWQGNLINDLEEHVFRIHPAIGAIKAELLLAEALYASMSGSGSAVYGIFDERPDHLRWLYDHRHWIMPL